VHRRRIQLEYAHTFRPTFLVPEKGQPIALHPARGLNAHQESRFWMTLTQTVHQATNSSMVIRRVIENAGVQHRAVVVTDLDVDPALAAVAAYGDV
jgi:hypothetical protein